MNGMEWNVCFQLAVRRDAASECVPRRHQDRLRFRKVSHYSLDILPLHIVITSCIHGTRQLFRVFSSDCRDPLYEESGEGTPLYNPYTNTSMQINPSPNGKADEHSRDSGSNRGKDTDEVVFATFAAGLAFLCGGSPTGVSLIHIHIQMQCIFIDVVYIHIRMYMYNIYTTLTKCPISIYRTR